MLYENIPANKHGMGEVQIFTETELHEDLVDLASGEQGERMVETPGSPGLPEMFRMLGGGVCKRPPRLASSCEPWSHTWMVKACVVKAARVALEQPAAKTTVRMSCGRNAKQVKGFGFSFLWSWGPQLLRGWGLRLWV